MSRMPNKITRDGISWYKCKRCKCSKCGTTTHVFNYETSRGEVIHRCFRCNNGQGFNGHVS